MMADKHKTVVKIKNKILTFERMKNSTLRYLTNIDKNRDEIFSNHIKKQIYINTVHEILGHPCEDHLRATATKNNIRLMGELSPCHGCMSSKSRQKNVRKQTETKEERPGERLFVYISVPFHPTLKGNRYWLKFVDDFSRYSTRVFIKFKDQLKDELVKYIKELNAKEKQVKCVRMDNSGENIGNTIKELKQMGIEVELTAPHTPQHNGFVERNFFTDQCSSQVMLTSAHLTKKTAEILWDEAVSTSEKLKNFRVNTHNRDTSPYELFHGKTPKILKGLIQFGRVRYVTIRDKFKSKFSPKSNRFLMVGYADDHQYNVYRMYNPTVRISIPKLALELFTNVCRT